MAAIQRNMRVKAWVTGILGLAFLATATIAGNAGGDDDEGASWATRLVREGKALPLTTILEKLRPETGPNVLEVELEEGHGGWVYEVYFLGKDGQRQEIYVNALTGEILPQQAED